MKYLLIDTATSFTHLAIGSEEGLIEHKSFISNAKQSDETLPSIIELLAKHHLVLQDINVIFLGIGPGSFTGTRVGVCIGKTIGYSLHIPVVPFCSLCCFSPQEQGPFCIVTDAKNKKLYLHLGNKTEEGLLFYDQPILIEKEQLKDYQDNYCLVSPDQIPFEGSIFPAIIDLSFVIKKCLKEALNNSGIDAKQVEVLYLRYAKDL